MRKIISADYHRNGISGEGFWSILFNDSQEGLMHASLFRDDAGYCAVHKVSELVKQNVEFACGNSWRGDNYEDWLRRAVDEFKSDAEWHTPLVGAPERARTELAEYRREDRMATIHNIVTP